jgi:hypothetical protein
MNYIKICVPRESWGISVFQLFPISINPSDRLDEILTTFSTRYDLLAVRFFHILGVLPHLIKCDPPEKKAYVAGLANLPDEIALDCNIFDTSAILATPSASPK